MKFTETFTLIRGWTFLNLMAVAAAPQSFLLVRLKRFRLKQFLKVVHMKSTQSYYGFAPKGKYLQRKYTMRLKKRFLSFTLASDLSHDSLRGFTYHVEDRLQDELCPCLIYCALVSFWGYQIESARIQQHIKLNICRTDSNLITKLFQFHQPSP